MSLSFELLLSKALAKRGADGRYIGFNFLLAEGVLGTLCLVIATIQGVGFQVISFQGFWVLMLAGLTGVIAISVL